MASSAKLTHRTRGALSSRAQQARDRAGEVFASGVGHRKPGTYLLPWPKADVEACQLLREWRGPTEPNPEGSRHEADARGISGRLLLKVDIIPPLGDFCIDRAEWVDAERPWLACWYVGAYETEIRRNTDGHRSNGDGGRIAGAAGNEDRQRAAAEEPRVDEE